jgi:hypothetical protein
MAGVAVRALVPGGDLGKTGDRKRRIEQRQAFRTRDQPPRDDGDEVARAQALGEDEKLGTDKVTRRIRLSFAKASSATPLKPPPTQDTRAWSRARATG